MNKGSVCLTVGLWYDIFGETDMVTTRIAKPSKQGSKRIRPQERESTRDRLLRAILSGPPLSEEAHEYLTSAIRESREASLADPLLG